MPGGLNPSKEVSVITDRYTDKNDAAKGTTRAAKRADIDDILIHIGGVGKYQISWFIVVVAGMLSGAFINYSLNYFTLQPIYQCYGAKGW